MPTPTEELYSLHETSPYIELFKVDCTQIGGSIYRFTPNVLPDGSNIVFGTQTYLPLPIETSGWELSANGEQPRPTLTVSNVNSTLLAGVVTLGDLVNAKVTRFRTFQKFLDGQSAADPTKYIRPVDIYYIFQKVAHNKNVISWKLASPVEAFTTMLPGRQYLKDRGFPGVSRVRAG